MTKQDIDWDEQQGKGPGKNPPPFYFMASVKLEKFFLVINTGKCKKNQNRNACN